MSTLNLQYKLFYATEHDTFLEKFFLENKNKHTQNNDSSKKFKKFTDGLLKL